MFENKTTQVTGLTVTRLSGRPGAAVAIPNPIPMTTRRQTANDDTLFWTLKLLQDNPGMTQRSLAKGVGINVSSINFCLQALVEKGWLKLGNFSRNPRKMQYVYLLTPTGVAEKAELTKRFLQRKMAEYEKLRVEIEALQLEAGGPLNADDTKVPTT